MADYRREGDCLYLSPAAYWKAANVATAAFIRATPSDGPKQFLSTFRGQPDEMVDAAMGALCIDGMSRDEFRRLELYLDA